jgi:hypothetical protein
MANTKIQNLPIVGLNQISESGWYFYTSDVSNFRDARIKASDLFTTVTSVGTGKSLLQGSSTFNSISLKTLNVGSTGLSIKDSSGGLSINLEHAQINLGSCDNSTSAFLSTVDLGTDVGTSTLSIVNGGTGTNDQASGLNLLSDSAGGTAYQLLKTDGTAASWAGIDSIVTAGTGLEWDITTSPYTLNVTLDDVTFTSNITFNNTVTISNQNLGMGTGWISNDGGSEGINIDTSGNVFVGIGAAVFDEVLTLSGNLSFASGATRSIELVPPSTGAGDEFKINGSSPTGSNQAGGAVTLTGGTGTGTGIGGAINLLAGNSGSGNGDINMSVCDGGTVSQVLKLHGSNKHFTFGSTGVNNNAVVDIQNDTTSAACLELDQNDTDEPFIIFTGTTAADQTKSLSTDTSVGALTGHVRVNINGTDYWIAYYVPN